MNDEMAQRNQVIGDIKKRWKISDSGLGRMFKLTRERISQILEEQEKLSTQKPFDKDGGKNKIKERSEKH